MEQFFKTLTELIKQSKYILIETHANPDFDGLGSAIALQQFINKIGVENYIILNKRNMNESLKKAFNLLDKKNIKYQTITKTEALKNIDRTLLIILDTHKKQMLECPQTVDKCNNIIICDHHIKSKDNIKNTSISYINSNMSSTVEIITNYLRFVNFKVNEIIATFLLVGLEVDTNTFKLKTTDKTYETAAYLTKLGADSILKQELLKQSKEYYLKKQKLIEKSFMLNKNTAVCIFDENIYEKRDLAIVAEELLQFENVEASYAIGYVNKNIIGISARSIGTVDVEAIMTKLGGGGHINEAAAQLDGLTLKEAFENLKKVLE